jgi:hypothetical protein
MSRGASVRHRQRSCWGARKSSSFRGGPNGLHRWIERDDMPIPLRAPGLDDLGAAHDEPEHDKGRSFSIFARGAAD